MENDSTVFKFRSHFGSSGLLLWLKLSSSFAREPVFACVHDFVVLETEWQGDVWSGMFVHRDYCRNTAGPLPFKSGPEQMSSLMKLWIVVCGDQRDATGRELDGLVVTRGNDDTGLNLRKILDLTTLGRYVVAESATEVFSCAYEACSAWDVLVPNHENGTPTTGRKYVAEYDVDNDLSDLGPRLSRKTHYTLIKFSVQRKVAEANCLSFGTFASELSKSDTTGREPDGRDVVRGHDVSGQNMEDL